MSFVNVVPSLQVSAFETTVAWYERLFGRVPDRRPMDGCVEWQLTTNGGLQIFRNPDHAAAATCIIGLEDLDAFAAELDGRGISAEPFDVPSGQFRLAQLEDPSGNTIVLSQELR
jgi:predicted enzyme related to lactoylglutathione lyase